MDYTEKRNRKIIHHLLPQPIKSGKGLVNTLINKLPFEAHVPGYKFLGPGTNLDLRLERGTKPKNKLDKLALEHDIAYSKSNDLKSRHKADYALQEGAWKRVLDPSASLGEKSAAWLTTNAMKLKRSVGAGLAVKYIKTPVTLNDEEQKKILESKGPVQLKLSYTSFTRTKNSVINETYLPLTPSQVKNAHDAVKKKKILTLKLSLKQIKYLRDNNRTGGFLPALIAAAPTIAALGTLASSVYNSYQNKKANDRLIDEKIRHNRAVESAGKGIYINKRPIKGNGLLKQLIKKKRSTE